MKHLQSHLNFLRFAIVVILTLATLYAQIAGAQPADQASPTLERQVYDAFDRGDYARAAELLESQLKQAPHDPNNWYNLACAHCQLKNYDAAASDLLKAFKAGFRDIEHMRRDPDLSGLRDHPSFKAILEQADRLAASNSKTAVERWKQQYGSENYRYESDEKRRINYATALDETSHKEMREMLEREEDQLTKTIFDAPPSYYVLIAIPTPDDADKFFNGQDSIGGMYQHSVRRLVARDIGSSLRHEFVHAMHFGDMERRGQAQPLWIQEGLAALYEDYEVQPDGSFKFLPNDRQIVAKARARAGSLSKWKDLMAMTGEQFMDRAQQNYPQVRSIFEYLADQDKLVEWYHTYTKHFEEDRSGFKAFEIVFGKPIAEVEHAWRVWLMKQPAINLQIRPNDAALGISSHENLSNDGVLITQIVPGSAAARSRLRKGDTIVAVDGKSTRTLVELRKVIASKQVGDEVEVKARRDGEYFTVKIVLRPVYGT